MTSDISEELEHYLDVWSKVLQTFLGWSASQVRGWAATFLEEDADLTVHEPPTYWVAPALVPDEVKARLSPERFARLVADVQYALDEGDAFWAAGTVELDAARSRVGDVLARYAPERAGGSEEENAA